MNNKLINISRKCLCVLLMCASLVSCKIGGSDTSNNNNDNASASINSPIKEKLQSPTITYVHVTNDSIIDMLWNEVESATGYVIEINGEEFTTNNTQFTYTVKAYKTNIKVKAIDETNNFNDSIWTDTYTHIYEDAIYTIKNLTYDDMACMYTWEPIDNIEYYIININGEEFYTENNYFKYIPLIETEAKVCSVFLKTIEGPSVPLPTRSFWSDVHTYKKGEIASLPSINIFVNNMLPTAYKLVKIVSMNIKDNVLYTDAVFTKGTTNYLYQMKNTYEHNLVSLEDAMNSYDYPGAEIMWHSETVEYDSASYLVESNEFCGELENYRQQGYNISVVSSYTITKSGYEDGRQFWIYATYKLDSGYDIKYLKNIIRCKIKNPSTNEKLNYTIKLKDPQQRKLTEEYFELISPEATKFCELMDKYNNQ